MHKRALKQIMLDQHDEFTKNKVTVPRIMNLDPHFRSLDYVSVLSGVRRCGKSTVLKQICRQLPTNSQIFYLHLEDPRLAAFQANDFENAHTIWLEIIRASSTGHNYFFFDEVQNVVGWERWIDYFAQRPKTKVFVTGSNSQLLSSELSTFLTGRQLPLRLTPFSLEELVQHHFGDTTTIKQKRNSPEGRAELQKIFNAYTKFGGFPRSYLDKNTAILPELYLDILRRDILPRLKRASLRSLIELGQILAAESGRLFNRTNVAPIIGVRSVPTVGNYCQKFCDTFLYREIRAFARSLRKQLRSLSKFYCVDHVLSREAGLKFPAADSLDESGDLEMMVFNELSRRRNQIFYWHSKNGFEVDFLEVGGKKPMAALQVAYNIDLSSTRDREIRALLAAKQELGVTDLKIITANSYEEIEIKGVKIEVVPFLEWALGGQGL